MTGPRKTMKKRRSPRTARKATSSQTSRPAGAASGAPRTSSGRRILLAVLGLAVVLAATGVAFRLWHRGDAAPPGATDARRDNILLITLDTTRADHIGAYGYARARTRHLDRLAAEGVRFEWAFSSAPITLPSHATIFTGLYPFEHGVRNNGNFYLSDRFSTLATVLAGQGYRAAAFVSAFVLDRRYGLARGFEVYDDRMQGAQAQVVSLEAERRGDHTAEALDRWLDQYAAAPPSASGAAGAGGNRAPFFAWLHLYDPHEPYQAPQPFGGAFADSPYRRGDRLRRCDRGLGARQAAPVGPSRHDTHCRRRRSWGEPRRPRRGDALDVRVRQRHPGAVHCVAPGPPGAACRAGTRAVDGRGAHVAGSRWGAGPSDAARTKPGADHAGRASGRAAAHLRRNLPAGVLFELGAAAHLARRALEVHRCAPAGALRRVARSRRDEEPVRRADEDGRGHAAGAPDAHRWLCGGHGDGPPRPRGEGKAGCARLHRGRGRAGPPAPRGGARRSQGHDCRVQPPAARQQRRARPAVLRGVADRAGRAAGEPAQRLRTARAGQRTHGDGTVPATRSRNTGTTSSSCRPAPTRTCGLPSAKCA